MVASLLSLINSLEIRILQDVFHLNLLDDVRHYQLIGLTAILSWDISSLKAPSFMISVDLISYPVLEADQWLRNTPTNNLDVHVDLLCTSYRELQLGSSMVCVLWPDNSYSLEPMNDLARKSTFTKNSACTRYYSRHMIYPENPY